MINAGVEGSGAWYLPGVKVDFESTPGRIRYSDPDSYHLGFFIWRMLPHLRGKAEPLTDSV